MAITDTNLNIRIDRELKEQADELFTELGLTLSSAVNVFLRQAVRQHKIPFEISLNTPNAETIAAMQEIQDMKNGIIPKHPQSVESLFEELEINVDP